MTLDPFGVICDGTSKAWTLSSQSQHSQGYMAVSDVGRMAMGSSRSELPLQRLSVDEQKNSALQYSRARDPCDFGRETLDVILFTLEDFLRYEHGEIRVLHSQLLDLGVEPF